MRLLRAATLGGAALVLLASVACAQGIGEAAAKEKEKRKATPKAAKIYTEDSIGRSMAPVSSSDLPPATDAAKTDKGDKPADGAAAAASGAAPGTSGEKKDKPEDDPRVKAEAEWRQKLEQARKEEAGYQDMVNKVQLSLNDTSSLYSPARAANLQLLEENQKKLAEVKTRIASLEEEGRRNAYR
jgi:hypothetical protein